MVFFNGKTSTFKKFNLRGKQDSCSVCGTNPSITDPKEFDYESLCPTPACSLVSVISLPSENDLTVQDFQKDKLEIPSKIAIIDVRPSEQFSIVNIPGSVNIPLSDLTSGSKQKEVESLAESFEKVYVLCRRGNASRKGTRYLLDKGLTNVFNIKGGLTEYINEIDTDMPMY